MAGYYRLSVSIISRSTGRSAVACAAYRSGAVLRDERYGTTHDYARRRGIYETGIDAPKEAPEWVCDRERLWNAIEAAERRKDAQLAREFVLAFPHQLNRDQRLELLREFTAAEITSRGLVADWAIHAPNRFGDERNWHAHVMVSMRGISPDGFEATKDRSLNTPDQLMKWREAWSNVLNRAFERYQIRDEDGSICRVDHRSYEDRGIDREPGVHLGPHATAIERRSGQISERGELNRDIAEVNRQRDAVRRRAAEMTREELSVLSDETIAPEKPTRDRPERYRPDREGRYQPDHRHRSHDYRHERDP